MARRELVAGTLRYTIADDDRLPPDLATWAVLRTQVIDELTASPPPNRVSLTTNAGRARIGGSGYCGVVARPRDLAHALLTPGSFTVSVAADGYLVRDLTPAIDAARSSLASPAAAGAMTLDVTPPDAVPPLQFRTGRGVLLGRAAPTARDQFTTVAPGTAPPGLVPLAQGADAFRPAATRLAGVPLVLPPQPLHRAAPIALQVHLRRRTGPLSVVPAAGAQIGIAGVWFTYPEAQTQPPITAQMCAVAPPLRFPYQAGAAVQRVTLGVAGAPRRLSAPAPLGTRQLAVAPNAGLNPAGGDLLRLGDASLQESEVVVSSGFVPVSDPNAPVTLGLTAPTAFIHRVADIVRDVTVTGALAVGTTGREALPGDAVLFAGGLAALPTTGAIVIEPGTARAAYHTATQYPAWDGATFTHQAALDSDGRATWPPLARVAQLRLFARHPAHPAQQVDFTLTQMADNAVSIIFT